MIEKVVITDAFLQEQGEIRLHPALLPWQKILLAKRQDWQLEVARFTPISWFAKSFERVVMQQSMNAQQQAKLGQGEVNATALLAAELAGSDDVSDVQQYWLLSPYHARLTRAQLRVMPEHMLDWSEIEAIAVCALLNPLVQDAGWKLHRVGCALLLSTNRVWDVQSPDFANISGHSLPDRQLQGEDAGAWMRLLTEIQMTLHQNPIETAQGVAIHGLWAWQACPADVVDVHHLNEHDGVWQHVQAVATRDAYLQALLTAKDKTREAEWIITAAEDLPMLLSEAMPVPATWILLGEGQSVTLSASWWRRCRALCYQTTWKGVKKR